MQASGVEVRLELRKVNVVESLDRFELYHDMLPDD